MSNGSGLSCGDRNRNAQLARLRELVPLSNAIVGIDLADDTQAAVVTDHDSRVIVRRRVSARAWELGELLDWAVAGAAGAGFASVTVACEPTGHRWRVLDQLAAGRGLALVCVQPLLVYRAREGEDLARDKSDPKDAVLIARLASELRCYEPERADAVCGWAWAGSPRPCGGSCPGGAGSGRACGSSGPCSRRWPIPPGSPRTAPAPWNARTWRWATDGISAPGSPIPRPGCARSWRSSGWRTWSRRSRG